MNFSIEMTLEGMCKEDLETAINLALGRILRMGARPTQPGDVEMYDKCRDIIIQASEKLDRLNG